MSSAKTTKMNNIWFQEPSLVIKISTLLQSLLELDSMGHQQRVGGTNTASFLLPPPQLRHSRCTATSSAQTF